MKSTFFTLCLCLLFWGCSCKKETNEPEQKKPEPTTDGRNTFYCEINGVPYYQRFVSGFSDFPRITGSFSNSPSLEGLDFSITYPNGNNSEYISFSGSNIFMVGKFNISVQDQKFLIYFKKNGCDFQNSNLFNSMSGTIEFTRYDINQRIFSGNFNFKNWLPDSLKGNCDTVKITNGIFDLKL